MAYQSATCGSSDSARGAEQGVAGNTAYDSTGAGAELGIGGVGRAGAEAEGGSKGSGNQKMSGLHGRVPFRRVEQKPRRKNSVR